MKKPVLLVDDDRELLEVYKKIFQMKNFDVMTCDNSLDAIRLVQKHDISVVVSDIIMPRMDGMELLQRIRECRPDCEVIMLTAEGSISEAVDAVKKGAFSYFVKPADIEELILSVQKAQELSEIKDENDTLKEHIANISEGQKFIGHSEIAENLRKKAEIIGKTDSTVLITGETGTGKEVLANLIHMNSRRVNKPFVCVNCGALNENLIEAELFGNEKGAYTGAERQRKGRFETANGGTIFFDEIGELSMGMQVKLLRVLQEKTFERVGGSESIKSDFRLIAATNRDLKKEVEENRFRADLYYRINIVPVEIPPLRERKDDIEELCQTFLMKYAKEMNKKMKPFQPELISLFQRYDWPGNIRELRNIIERLVVLSADGEICTEDLPEEIKVMAENDIEETGNLKDVTRAFEKEYIEKVLDKHHRNVAKAAEEMNIAKKNLYKKLNDYNIKYGKSDI